LKCYIGVKVQELKLQKLQISPHFNMYLVIYKGMTSLTVYSYSDHYLYNCSTFDVGMFGYMNVI
jgi:hypothetical protein